MILSSAQLLQREEKFSYFINELIHVISRPTSVYKMTKLFS